MIYPETTLDANFVLDNGEFFVDKTCFIMTGKDLSFLQSILSSTLYSYAYKRLFSSIELGNSGYQYNKHSLIKLPIILPSNVGENIYNELNSLALKINGFYEEVLFQIMDGIIFNIYNISIEEIEYIYQRRDG